MKKYVFELLCSFFELFYVLFFGVSSSCFMILGVCVG